MNKITSSYVETLYQNQNIGMDDNRMNLFSRSDYEKLLEPVDYILTNYGDVDLDVQRGFLFQRSSIKEMVDDFVYRKGIVPGLVTSYGTPLYNETLVVGSRQEMGIDFNGKVIPNIKLMEEDTIFDLASVTKLFTSISILKLVEDGTINMKDSIVEYAPQFKNLSNVTIFDLLSFNVPLRTSKRIDNAASKEEAEEILFDIAVDKENNNLNPYTDMGAMVLKYVIESASGLSYDDYLKKNVIDKLELHDTHTVVPDSKIARVASTNLGVHVLEEGNFKMDYGSPLGIVNDPKARILGQMDGNLSGHAGLFSSVKDMAALGKALAAGDILSEDSLKELAKNRTGRPIEGGKPVQYLGYLAYLKNFDKNSSDVYHALGGPSFTSSGRTGTQITVDPVNESHFAMAGGRTHNRILSIASGARDKIITNELGRKSILLPNGRSITDSTRFPWEKDGLVHAIQALTLQYKALEDIQGAKKQNVKPTAKTLCLF